MDEVEMFEGLFQWLTSFELANPPTSAEDLATGITFAEVLSLMDDTFFNEEWRSRLQFDLDNNSNWRIKATNLKKILKSIMDYYSEHLAMNTSVLSAPELNKIAEKADKHELNEMIQLLLGIAVNCSNNERYIQKITQFGPAVQQTLMTAIQALEGKQRAKSINYEENVQEEYSKALDELRLVKESRDTLFTRCEELQTQLSTIQDQNNHYRHDIDRLNAKLASVSSQDLDDPNTAAGRKLTQIQQRLEEVEEDLYKQEAAKEEFREKCEKLEKENRESNLRIDELKKMELSYQKMKDEADELRMRANEAKKFETTIETYKKRLEELGDLRGQVKTLEEKNTSLIRCAIDLEEEQKKTGVLKTQIESYKGLINELNEKLSAEIQKADKADFDLQKTMEKLDVLSKDRDRLAAELEILKETNEDREFSQLLQTPNNSTEIKRHNSDSQFVSVPVEIRENLLRLEHENKQLKESLQTSSDQKVVLLQGRLEETILMKEKLEADLRTAHRKILELESQQSDNQSISSTKDAETNETEKTGTRLYNMLKERNDKISQLEQKLEEKAGELQSQEAKYKSYIEKARTVIEALETRPVSSALQAGRESYGAISKVEFEELKRELSDKEKQLKKYLEEQERMRIMKEQEERLITTAFHNMAFQLFRQSSEDRMSRGNGGGKSFLDRQRQVVSRRPANSRSGSKSEVDDFAPTA